MDNQLFNNLVDIHEIAVFDVIDEDPQPNIPRLGNVYLRQIIDPYTYYDDEDFRKRYRFTKNTIRNCIIPLLGDIPRPGDRRGLPITPEIQILIALRFYATGSFQVVCGDLHCVSQPTVSHIVKNISAKLASLVGDFLKFPRSIGDEFESAQSRYPPLRHIRGAIDCTHIKIKRPRGITHTEVYRNRKGFFSINTQCVVGMDMKIYNIVARWPGSSHDSRIFRSCRLHSQLESGELNGVLVGDSGYRATTYMLTPFTNPRDPAQIRYNYVQVRTRNVVERFFGVWKKTYNCLQIGLNTKLTTTTNIIVACAVLHNIRIDNENLDILEDPYEEPSLSNSRPPNTASGLAFRNNIVQLYYNNPVNRD